MTDLLDAYEALARKVSLKVCYLTKHLDFFTRPRETYLMSMANRFTKTFLPLKAVIEENGLYACLHISAGWFNQMIWRLKTND